ncbi:hypothetical protein D9756_000839 [Leucocoprinus leucothites]|uniref:Bromodomain associated domain-containing protein n=1 Tax=Leucocoprinus leucothites TaxID=201217 RepID=A0A8H5LNB0_9AGAR|nr:hypothetical protein D9756_000839 [Leucoagaricus leucothites]
MDIGFESADAQSMWRLEVETVAYIQQLFERAHEYANLANRAGAITSDLLVTLNDFGVEPKELYPLAKKRRGLHPSVTTSSPAPNASTDSQPNPAIPAPTSKKRLKRKFRLSPTKLTFSASRSSSPELLASDDESGPP